MWFLQKIFYWIRISEESHEYNSWTAKKLQMWFLWKNFHQIRKYENSHQDSSWRNKKIQLRSFPVGDLKKCIKTIHRGRRNYECYSCEKSFLHPFNVFCESCWKFFAWKFEDSYQDNTYQEITNLMWFFSIAKVRSYLIQNYNNEFLEQMNIPKCLLPTYISNTGRVAVVVLLFFFSFSHASSSPSSSWRKVFAHFRPWFSCHLYKLLIKFRMMLISPHIFCHFVGVLYSRQVS